MSVVSCEEDCQGRSAKGWKIGNGNNPVFAMQMYPTNTEWNVRCGPISA